MSARRLGLAAMVLSLVASAGGAQGPARAPVFDAHLHLASAASRAAMAAMMDTMNIRGGVMMGTYSQLAEMPKSSLMLRGLMFPCEGGRMTTSGIDCHGDGTEFPDTVRLRAAILDGSVNVLGEITAQYMGVSPDDPRMEPYYRLAEALDIPMGIHLGIGPPGVAYPGPGFPPRKSPNYSGRAGSPLTLEPILVRHPKLRLYVMHAAWPFVDDMIYLLYMHPNLYADISVLQYAIPRPAYSAALEALVDAGFGKRLMYGSDGGARHQKAGVVAIREAAFLTDEQKQDILHDNAMRFFRLAPPTSSPPR